MDIDVDRMKIDGTVNSISEAIVADLADKNLDFERADSLTNMPRAFEDHAEHQLAPIVKLKSLVVKRDLPKSAWLDGSVVERVADHARDCGDLLAFGQTALEG